LILGPKGAGKTLHGRNLARKLGLFHIQFRERLQELIIAKTKKKIGPEYEEEDEEQEPEIEDR
jgi:adenylate/nucleoside-diphosphate kinase